ncbi:MAG: biopolymer transporter ExbD [Flavobacteriaceae bacterium]|nr:biopolymer transporter ExbD [Flavobacteriaceae bacterium]
MGKFKKKKDGELPQASTAALPDIVFMLLFFFMTVTVMKDKSLLVENKLPAADDIEKLNRKNDRVMYIYAGKPVKGYEKYGTEAVLQLNDKIAHPSDLKQFIHSEIALRDQEIIPFMVTALKVDRDANMGLVSDIKLALRKENMLKINYLSVKPSKR